MSVEDGKISLDTKITPIFEPTSLDNLFIFNDTDDQVVVTIEHLLTHTFGVNDYFVCKTINNCKFLSEVINNPDTFWTPSSLINFTRENQVAVGKTRSIFLYPDTGFVLFGLIIQILYGASFSDCLDYYIFKPTQMNDSCFAFYNDNFKAEELALLFLEDKDVHIYRSLSYGSPGGVYQRPQLT